MKKLYFLFFLLPNLLLAQISIPKMEADSHRGILNYTANPATQNYDLTYCRLELNLDPSQDDISGDVTAYFKAKSDLSQIVFDLKQNMNVSQVAHHGNSLSFSHIDDNLVIDLPQIQAQGITDSLTISYSGTPESGGFGYFEQAQHNGRDIVWTLSEPYGAEYWWPTKQDLNDKIDSIDVFITFPEYNAQNEENVAVTNGKEISQQVDGNLKTTHFHHSYPIPAYLIGVAVTNYNIHTDMVNNNGSPFPVINYLYPETESYVLPQTATTPDIIEFYNEKFGEYPYADEKYGHAQFGWGGGMEHTTVSFMGGFSQELIAHELGHQWFGDKVTCASWQDVWLNEGFANFMYALVREEFNSENSYKSWRESTVNSITSSSGGSVYVPAEDTLNVSRVFSSRLSYDKGGMVLHMLRRKLGDEDFFQACRNYLENPNFSYGYADTEDLKTEFENESGLDLDEFFNDWIYGEGYPSYHIDWFQDNNQKIHLVLSQTQSKPTVTDFFEGTVPIHIVGPNNQSLDVELDQTENEQHFIIDCNFTANQIKIDPETEVISKNNSSTLSIDSYQIKKIKMYPNPAESTVYFDLPEGLEIDQVKIYNTLGKLVKETTFKNQILIIDLSEGLYFVELNSGEKKYVKSLIVK